MANITNEVLEQIKAGRSFLSDLDAEHTQNLKNGCKDCSVENYETLFDIMFALAAKVYLDQYDDVTKELVRQMLIIIGDYQIKMPPKVSAGADQVVSIDASPAVFTANIILGSGSLTSILWEQISGTPATLSGVTTASISVSNFAVGPMVFKVTVTDSNGLIASDTVTLTGSNATAKLAYFTTGAFTTIPDYNTIVTTWTPVTFQPGGQIDFPFNVTELSILKVAYPQSEPIKNRWIDINDVLLFGAIGTEEDLFGAGVVVNGVIPLRVHTSNYLTSYSKSAPSGIRFVTNGTPPVEPDPDPEPEPEEFVDKFAFNLDEARTTSAGIYDTEGVLRRTLWGAIPFEAGTHVEIWDGKDDLGNTIVGTGVFQPRILDHKIEYEWAGVWCNTSDNQTGDDMHKPLDPVIGLRIMPYPPTNQEVLYGVSGYGEGGAAEFFSFTSTPQKRFNPIVIAGTNQNTDHVAFNSTHIFRAGYDPVDSRSESFVYATNRNSTELSTFEYGVKAKMEWGIEYQSVIGYMNEAVKGSTDISGIAANDNYIYLSRKVWGTISILNASTGQLLNTLTIDTPSSVCIIGTNLWYATGSTSIVKRPINSDGSLGSVILTINGFQNVLDINFFGNNVSVIDGGNSQQIKTYNINTGALVWVRGQLKGFKGTGNKEVFNDKFLFNKPTSNGDNLSSEFGSIAYQSDGSYWVCDPGNTRIQHFSANGTFIDNIVYEVRNYNLKINKNQNKLILSTYRVFEVDPAKPIKQGWKPKYNFQDDTNLNKVDNFCTLSNGRMYGTRIANQVGAVTVKVVELDPLYGVRETKSTIPFGYYELSDEGAIRWVVDIEDGSLRGKQQWWRKDLLGFDGDNDPFWGDAIKVDEVAIGIADPKAGGPFSVKHSEQTENGLLWSYEAGISERDAPNQFRLGGHKNGKFYSKVLRTVEANHKGNFPDQGDFDWSNYARFYDIPGQPDNRPVTGYYGSKVSAFGKHVVASAHGEFWRGGQLNKHVHYHQDGLLIGVAGEQRVGGDQRKAPPFQAGNALTPNLQYWSEDDTLNIVHPDESVHQGDHRIKIKFPNSIRIQVGTPTTQPVRSLPGVNLLQGFKRGDIVTGNVNGWVIPSPFYTDDNNQFTVKVGTYSTDRYRLAGTDIKFDFIMPSGSTRTVSRDLENTLNLNSWNLKGLIEWDGNERNDPTDAAGHTIEILDDQGLVIADFLYKREGDIFGRTTFRCNGVIMKDFNQESTDMNVRNQAILDMHNTHLHKNLEIGKVGNSILFKYADFPSVTTTIKNMSANIGKPKTLRIRFYTQGNIYRRTVGFKELRFLTS